MGVLDDIWEFLKPFVPFLGGYEAIKNPPKGAKVTDYAACAANCDVPYDEKPAQEALCRQCTNAIGLEALVWFLKQAAPNFLIGGLAFSVAIGRILQELVERIAPKLIPGLGWVLAIGELVNILALIYVMVLVYQAWSQANELYCKCPRG